MPASPLRARRRALSLLLALAALPWSAAGQPAARPGPRPLRGADGRAGSAHVAAEALLAPGAAWVTARPSPTPSAPLGRVAASARAWLERHPDDPAALPAAVSAGGATPARLRATLDAIIQISVEDAISGEERLRDPRFVAAHFEVLRLQPEAAGAPRRSGAPAADALRITRYLVRQLEGRTTATGAFRHALYADPGPAARAAHTRAEVMAGAWDRAGATPLVYLTAAGVYDALLQGTVEVRTEDGRTRTFNVDQNNGHAYIPGERDPAKQRRYWSFREVEGALGYGLPGDKVQLEPMVSVAGDVMNLGLGALLAIDAADGPRLVILADTGGAFVENLRQLDYFGGAFPTHAALYAATQAVPERAAVALLLWRGPAPAP